ncbi:hypothetical protein LOTGIDRAFT_157294 [Lottia gigantea]|uniref:Amino acid transporter transmembrane domain-containing protein n=1 Tax=Lottia gigantea TaxID=225164 RepID=V4ADQ4_LOTGI|nr:hypothetical protein LOTGIDRAFT_157294 [Lottia gigantea]ESP02144.1 hypothetical protein LOTGIDRAFT_157294 [Lottia gigantea]
MAGPTNSGSGGSKNSIKIFANIFISFIGAGILGLPFAFKEAGILEGALIMTFVGFISVKAMLLIIDCKYQLMGKKLDSNTERSYIHTDDGLTEGHEEEYKELINEGEMMIRVKDPPKPIGDDLTYGDVGFHAMGPIGKLLVDMAIVISQTGFCCAYLIFIVKNLSDYITGVSIFSWLAILLPPLTLLTLIRHLNSLALSSLMAQVSNIFAFGVVFWFDFEHLYTVRIHPKEMSIKGFPFFLAIAIYCYEGAGMILSLESSVAQEKRHKFKKIFIISMVLATTLYITFGSAGYLSFGPQTNPIITLNLPKGSSVDFSMVVKSSLCLALLFTYPVMMFPVMKILERILIADADKHYWRGNILRCIMVSLTGIIVVLIPSFSNLMALIGSTCCTLLAFILPGVFHLYIFKGSLTRSQKFLDYFLILMGIVGSVVGLWDALKRLSEGEDEDLEVVEKVITTLSTVTNNTMISLTEHLKLTTREILKNTTS